MLKRILRAHAVQDQELDYAQGMNDFLSTLVYLSIHNKAQEPVVYCAFKQIMSLSVPALAPHNAHGFRKVFSCRARRQWSSSSSY